MGNSNGDVEKGIDNVDATQGAATEMSEPQGGSEPGVDAASAKGRVGCTDRACATPSSGSGSSNGNGDDKEMSTLVENNRVRVLSGILVGDFMHNLVDGIVIGAAFLGCSKSMAWGITGATIAHEIAQEIADYFVLTDPRQGALTPFMALLLNFLSGTSVILGAIIVLGQDKVDNFSQGLLLAYGGGVYLQIAASECMPRALKFAKTVTMNAVSLFTFLLGALCIATILLKHEHCVPEAGGGAHAGHAH